MTRKPAGIAFLAVSLLSLALASPVAAQYFGQNKVQYRKFDWHILKTKHFEVYFYPQEREAAMDAARMAERAYARLSRVLAHEIKEPVPVVLYASHSDFEQTNITPGILDEGTGGVTEFIKRRVFLPFTGSYAEMDHVLTHELVHAFQVDIVFARREGILTNPFTFQPPGWFMEGMAEYLSLGEVDTNTRMWLRDASLQGYLLPLETLSYAGDIRIYRFGQSFWEYFADRFGAEKIGVALKKTAEARSLERGFEYACGMTLEKLSEGWTEAVRKTYLPEIAQYEKPTEFARQLTDHEDDRSNFNIVPSISPNGDRFVFISDRSLYNDLYLASAIDGKVLGRLVKGERSRDFESLRFFATSISWSPDGKEIAFPAKVGPQDAIYILDVDRREVRKKLTFGLSGILSPTWSPDGTELIFVGLEGGQSDLYRVDRDGGNLERLTRDRFADFDPQWSPTGRYVAFTSDRGPETDFSRLEYVPTRITILDLETGETRVLPGQSGRNLAPYWSPDETQILYVSDRHGIANIWRIDVATGEGEKLSNILTGVSGITAYSPPISWSRNGNRLLFSAFSAAGWDVYAIKDPLNLTARRKLERGESTTASTAPDSAAAGRDSSLAGAGPGEPPAPGRETAPAEGGTSAEAAGDAARDTTGAAPPPSPLALPRAGALDDLRSPGSKTLPGSTDSLEASLPDTTSFVVRPYRSRFTADYASTAAAFGANVGFGGQAYLSFSDVLGNHNILVGASIFGSITDSDLYFQYLNLARRWNWGFALFQFRNDFYLTTRPESDQFESQIYRGVELLARRPFSRFSRIEFGLQGVGISRRVFEQSFLGEIEEVEKKGTITYVAPSVALVHDNALYGNVGPISGGRSRFSVEQAIGNLSLTNYVGDWRRYLNLFQRYAFAFRAVGASSQGADPQVFRIGGPFTYRGAGYGSLDGTNIGLVNVEFRFPLIDRLDLGWPLPFQFRSIRGVLFTDYAASWGHETDQEKFQPFRQGPSGWQLNDLRFAYGFGARLNLGYFVLKYDVAQPTDFRHDLGHARHFVTLGADF